MGSFVLVLLESFSGGLEVLFVDVKPSEQWDVHSLGCDGGGSNAKEWVEEVVGLFLAVEADALLNEFDGEGGGVWALSGAGFDRLVGNKPVVAPASFVVASGVAPTGDI